MFGRWWRKTFTREADMRGVRVVVYTRDRCPLCDDAAQFLETRRPALGFSLDYIDIDSDERLRELHGNWVPVVEVEGKVRFRGRIDSVLWRRLEMALRRGR